MTLGRTHLASTAPTAVLAPASATQTPDHRLSGIKVMVIDDSNTIRRSAEMLVKQADCEVILAEDGFEALQKISIHRPDIIFTDLLMPRLNGYQACALIKRSEAYRHIPVVMLTSKDTIFDRARGLGLGSSQCLTKPFTKETLLRMVESLVPRKCVAPAALPN